MLISNIDLLKTYIPTVVGDNYDRYINFLDSADEYLQSELIGETLYTKLFDSEGNEPDAKLVRYCSNIVALKAYLDAIPMLDLVETENGFGVVMNQNIAPASKDRVASLVNGITNRLTDAIEQLLEYLEGNADFYDDWKVAKAYTINHDSYIFTLKQFRRYARYDGSRLEWIKDMPKITQAIRLKIEPAISAELSALIINELQNDDLSEANALIIEDLRFALAAFVTDNEALGLSSLHRAVATMRKNVEDYPEYEESDIYMAYLAQTDTYSSDHAIANFGV